MILMGEKSRMSNLRALVTRFEQADDRTDSWVSAKMGLERGALWSWWNRGLSVMPSPALLYQLAAAIRTPYSDVLNAALHDFGYLPEATARSITMHEDVSEDVSLNIERRPS